MFKTSLGLLILLGHEQCKAHFQQLLVIIVTNVCKSWPVFHLLLNSQILSQ